MRKLFFVCVLVAMLAAPAVAGEKEELQLKWQLLLETEKRVQLEFELLQRNKKEVGARLKAIIDAEKAAKADAKADTD